jgi:hypothetical protein
VVNPDLEIRELRPHNLELAVAMAEGVSEPVNPQDVVHAQSLVVFRGEAMVAAALFEQCADKRRLVVCAATHVEAGDDHEETGDDHEKTGEDQAETSEDSAGPATDAASDGEGGEAESAEEGRAVRSVTPHDIAVLIDKALMKLHSSGVRRFGIDLVACGSEDALQGADFLRGIARDQAA